MHAKLLFLFLVCLLIGVARQRQLKFIEVVSRHGVRYPSYPNDYDHSNITTIRNAYNQLTIEGKSMHYLLGRQLYRKYWKLLFANTPYQSSYHQSLILAKSTNTNRTIESLQSQLFGLLQDLKSIKDVNVSPFFFPPFASINQSESFFKRQQLSALFTFPIHVEKGAEGDPRIANLNYEGDFLVKQQTNLCPNQPIWEQINFISPFAIKLQASQKLKPAFNFLNQIYHTNNISMRDAYKYYDNYICLKAMGQPYLISFQNPQLTQSLEFLYIGRLYLSFLYTQQQKKTFSSTLLAKTIDSMRQSLKENTPKIVLYAAHDVTIAILLASMNFSSIECIAERYLSGKTNQDCYFQYPTFASTFIFQLWQQDNKELTISVLINGEPKRIPICNYSLHCPIKTFQSWFNSFKVESPNRQCGVKSEFFVYSSNILFLILLFCCGLLTPVIVQKFKSKVIISDQLNGDDPQISDFIE